MLRVAALGAMVLALSTPLMPSAAKADIRVGTLNCQGAGSTSYVVGSTEDLRCIFLPTSGAPQHYRGSVQRFGVDLGFTRQSAVGWLVFAPTGRIGRGDLAGRYGGVSAAATVGVGIGANALVGGSSNSFTLQPLSLQGQTGLNIAAGIARLDLSSEDRPRRRRQR